MSYVMSKEEFTQKLLEIQKLKRIDEEKRKEKEYDDYVTAKIFDRKIQKETHKIKKAVNVRRHIG